MTTQDPRTTSPEDLDPAALAAIRDLLASQPAIKPQSVRKRVAARQEAATAPVQPVARQSQPARRSIEGPTVEPIEKAIYVDRAPRRGSVLQGVASRLAPLKARVTGYRPPRKHIVWAALALVVFLRPGLVFMLALLAVLTVLAAFLFLGYDGFWRGVMGIGHRYARLRPARAAQMRARLDRFAVRFDAFLDRFPEGTVDGLYLPDFGQLAAADDKHDAAMRRRLDALRDTATTAQG